MSNIFFFLKNQERFKTFLLILVIAIPIFAGAIFVVSKYESTAALEGTPNDKGGLNYYYRESSGVDKFPKPLTKLISMYPNSQTTYLNISTNNQNELSGNIYAFTKDDFVKVQEYYKSSGEIIDQTKTRLQIDKNDLTIMIEKENILEDDPIKGQTKFSIYITRK